MAIYSVTCNISEPEIPPVDFEAKTDSAAQAAILFATVYGLTSALVDVENDGVFQQFDVVETKIGHFSAREI